MTNIAWKLVLKLVLFSVTATNVYAVEIAIPPVKDNTLYEDAGGNLSNGSGAHFFAGRVGAGGGGALRRGLIAFDIAAAVPAGSTITNATLTLNMSKTASGASTVSLHKVSADWGEGTSNADLEEGQGALATTNDATWTKRFFGTPMDWLTVGGDFAGTASASTSVNLTGPYTWSSAGMLADVVSWHTTPASNFGWIIRGDETVVGSAKRFDSRENPTLQNRPALTIVFTPPSAVPDWTVY